MKEDTERFENEGGFIPPHDEENAIYLSAEVCPYCQQQTLFITEGCEVCKNCGFSMCEI